MEKVLKKEEFHKLIGELLKEFELIGPQELPNKGIFYQPIIKPEDLYLGEGFTTEPVKKFFLNPSQWLLESQFKDGQDSLEEAALPNSKRVIIGVRPCETRGLTLLDKVFNSDYKDNFYLNNRQRTIIVGLACLKPDTSCFCTSMGGSPVESRGMDALLFAVDGGFAVEVVTDKGREIFGSLEDAEKLDKNKSKELVKTKIKVPETLDGVFESDYWSKVSSACLSCGICTYLCPTCHCFDLVDEERRKLRCYDGCAFPDFTQETSGVNPRPTKKERFRQRVFHKFDYFKKNFGENLCVGCGRCIRFCPVKIDIAEIVAKAPIGR